MIEVDETTTTISIDTTWRMRGQFLMSPTGRKMCRIGRYGILWLWDKDLQRELPLTLAMMKQLWQKVDNGNEAEVDATAES